MNNLNFENFKLLRKTKRNQKLEIEVLKKQITIITRCV